MIPIPTILDAVVTTLRANTALVQDVAGEENITPYSDQFPPRRNVEEAIDSMFTPSILVIHDRVSIVPEHDFPRWSHQLRLVIKADGCESDSAGRAGYYEILDHLINAGQFAECDVMPSTFPPSEIEIERVSDGNGQDLYAVTFSVVEIGG